MGPRRPPPTPDPSPPPPPRISSGGGGGSLLENPRGGGLPGEEGGGEGGGEGPGVCTGNLGGGEGSGVGAPRPHLPRKRAPFSAKTPFLEEEHGIPEKQGKENQGNGTTDRIRGGMIARTCMVPTLAKLSS